MQVVHEVCYGLDIHKKSVTACVLWASGRRRQTREFGTFTRELRAGRVRSPRPGLGRVMVREKRVFS